MHAQEPSKVFWAPKHQDLLVRMQDLRRRSLLSGNTALEAKSSLKFYTSIRTGLVDFGNKVLEVKSSLQFYSSTRTALEKFVKLSPSPLLQASARLGVLGIRVLGCNGSGSTGYCSWAFPTSPPTA